MIVRERRSRPAPFLDRMRSPAPRWVRPFLALEWVWEWIAFPLSNWAFLEVLEYLGSFSVLVAVILYFSESGDRIKQRHYQAWQVINTAQGKGGSGGRIEALQELNADHVPLVGVDVSSAFLQGIRLRNADLLRSNFSAADLRKGDLNGCNFMLANLGSANFRGAQLDHASFVQADLRNADLNGAGLAGADLTGTMLDDADMRGTDLSNIQWKSLRSITGANLAGAKNAPAEFIDWAMKNGAVNRPDADQ
jgi:hypothetical protein